MILNYFYLEFFFLFGLLTREGYFVYFQDNVGVIVPNKGEMKGSSILGIIAKECADLWTKLSESVV